MKVNVKKALDKKRIIGLLIIFALILIMALSNPEVQNFLQNNDGVKLDFQTGVEYDMESDGNEVLLVNNEGLFAVDKYGRESWNAVISTTSPYMQMKGKYILVTDINGKTARLFQKEKIVSQIETENEILCAKVNKHGKIAIATDELGYKGMIILYDKNGKEQFRWHSGSGYIGDVDISPNDKIAVAQIMTDKEAAYTKIVAISPKSDEGPVCISELSGIVMKLRYRDNGELIAVSNNGLYGFKSSGKMDFEVDFEGNSPISCNIKNDNNMVLAFDSGLNSTVLESYSSSGKLRGRFNAESEIHTFDASGECIVLASREGIVKITPKGAVKKKIKASNDVKALKIFDGRNRLMVLGDGGAELIKLK
jgi:hypothetical protein